LDFKSKIINLVLMMLDIILEKMIMIMLCNLIATTKMGYQMKV